MTQQQQKQSDAGGKAIADYYDSVAEDWDASYGAARQNPYFAQEFSERLRSLLAPYAGKSLALELGAGTGAYIHLTAPLFGSVIASDLSGGMLKVFERRLRSSGISNIALRRLDACDLSEIESASVDVVYSIGLLETVPDLGRHMRECFRVLRPGGTLCGITSNGECPWYRIRWRLEGGERHCRRQELVAARELRDALMATGFEQPRIEQWGAVPPGLSSSSLGAALAAAGKLAARTPLARYLAVLSFRCRKPAENPAQG